MSFHKKQGNSIVPKSTSNRCGFHWSPGAIWLYMDISENNGTPKIIHFNRIFHYKPSILWYPYFWKHPYTSACNHQTSWQTYGLIFGIHPLFDEIPWQRYSSRMQQTQRTIDLLLKGQGRHYQRMYWPWFNMPNIARFSETFKNNPFKKRGDQWVSATSVFSHWWKLMCTWKLNTNMPLKTNMAMETHQF